MSNTRIIEWEPGKEENIVRYVVPEVILDGNGKIRVAHCRLVTDGDPGPRLALLIDAVAGLHKDPQFTKLRTPVQILQAIMGLMKIGLQDPETRIEEFTVSDYYACIWARTLWCGLPDEFDVRVFRHNGDNAYELINCSENMEDALLRSPQLYPPCSVCSRPSCRFHE
jgi:hypothetical protein